MMSLSAIHLKVSYHLALLELTIWILHDLLHNENQSMGWSFIYNQLEAYTFRSAALKMSAVIYKGDHLQDSDYYDFIEK